MAKFTKYTTPEDAAILNRLQPSPNFDRGAADFCDYQIMVSNERTKQWLESRYKHDERWTRDCILFARDTRVETDAASDPLAI